MGNKRNVADLNNMRIELLSRLHNNPHQLSLYRICKGLFTYSHTFEILRHWKECNFIDWTRNGRKNDFKLTKKGIFTLEGLRGEKDLPVIYYNEFFGSVKSSFNTSSLTSSRLSSS